MYRSFLYAAVEAGRTGAMPLRAAAGFGAHFFRNPLNPLAHTMAGRSMAATCDLIEQNTRRYHKPEFGIGEILVEGKRAQVREELVWATPFLELRHFVKVGAPKRPEQKLLIVAPMSGHFATLLRGTVARMLEDHDVYITDWIDARDIPREEGRFGLDEYIEHVIDSLRVLGPNTHLMAVCQPGPACLAAAALMHEDNDACAPATLTIMGSPIDARKSPTQPNKLSETRKLSWFRDHMVHRVPFTFAGAGRMVYPGFLQLTAFIEMNRDRHINAQHDQFMNLVKGDGESAARHREFYDEYLAVMDIDADFYLETVDRVFQKHDLALGRFMFRKRRVNPAAISDMGLMTIEGEKDDISGIGQTQAAHDLCVNVPKSRKVDHIQKGVGHYGVFNGSRWRSEIAPKVSAFIAANS